ncbi:DUF2961 domain-containing protein [Pedosphaera parvula]|uniref:DUF2961 domain-containing protein n=1 Tax=Pedosphaera parvula (strain Ellin514) TaxID=320771 RepID=B9XNF2_PEDPL|nr:DUF2961 domain-containing protein [Pedosphaera parvula]EEF58611.1 hypothetical protein Cflav_PD1512 [Pedosphaera parvula Ellin514]
MHLRLQLVFALLLTVTVQAEEPPMIPVGLDTYRMWERWPYQHIGQRAYMRSTYDRRGGNEGADASHFLYQLADDYNVSLDVAGPGVLYFARYNHWHGSPWHYNVDATDYVVQETSTANPNKPAENSVFMPGDAFPNPLTWTWSITKGADLMWVPIPFEKSFQMAYSRTHYGTGYYIYDKYVRGTKLSRPIRSWNEQMKPEQDVLDLINRVGSDLVPQPETREGRKLGITREAGTWSFSGGGTVGVERRTDKPQMLRALEFSVPKDKAIEFGRCKIRITWDDLPYSSVEAPIALFFGAGTLYNRDDREYLVKSFPMVVKFDQERVHLACYFPMPFLKSALIQLIGDGKSSVSDIQWSARFAPYKEPANQVGYFHATYQDHPHPEPGQDLVLLETRKTEGGGDWSGSLVGTSFIFTHQNDLGTLEGDPRFFFDDSLTPQAQGTGTEEWGGGGDYWGGRNMTLPFAGHPVGARKIEEAKCDEDKIHSAYRFLLADLMPFGKNALIRLEHGGENQSTQHYETVTYWYGLNSPSLVKTDTLQMGNEASEQLHRYDSPEATKPYEITSRYEWGIDNWKGKEIYPASTDIGRKTTGSSEFTMKLERKNLGVLLRRKLDYSFPNQKAEVYVAKVSHSGKSIIDSDWKLAGTWYLAGGNTCVYSNPKEELGATQHTVQTSNRRFRDDEFLIPGDLTEGRSEIRVKVKFTPMKIPLFPGQPLPELAWSEIRYDAYCFVMPKSKPVR